jgi:hypothetical protein
VLRGELRKRCGYCRELLTDLIGETRVIDGTTVHIEADTHHCWDDQPKWVRFDDDDWARCFDAPMDAYVAGAAEREAERKERVKREKRARYLARR